MIDAFDWTIITSILIAGVAWSRMEHGDDRGLTGEGSLREIDAALTDSPAWSGHAYRCTACHEHDPRNFRFCPNCGEDQGPPNEVTHR